MFNELTESLPTYPMEALANIRRDLQSQGRTVYDFGTGDPRIPTWNKIIESMSHNIPEVSQYPTISGSDDLRAAIWSYLARRFSYSPEAGFDILQTNGSKEAVFHIALSVVGRRGRQTILYPDPGYPVYKSSTLFAHGKPRPIPVTDKNSYEMRPWDLSEEVQNDVAAIWVNYPHNPTGALVSESYLSKLADWARAKDVLILSDDCYIDIYDQEWDTSGQKPIHPYRFAPERSLSFMSLSKRSGMTGYRSGFVLGPEALIASLKKARSNFGVATPLPIQAAAAVAWRNDEHVEKRRKIFSERLDYAYGVCSRLGLCHSKPLAGFYLWCRVPNQQDDVEFCLNLAKESGVIVSPAQWLGELSRGYFRMAMVPTLDQIKSALCELEKFLNK